MVKYGNNTHLQGRNRAAHGFRVAEEALHALLKEPLKVALQFDVVDKDDAVQLKGAHNVLAYKVIEHVADAAVLLVARGHAVRVCENGEAVALGDAPLFARVEELVLLGELGEGMHTQHTSEKKKKDACADGEKAASRNRQRTNKYASK